MGEHCEHLSYVADQLRQGWSPLQIAGRLRRMDEAERPGAVSHETICTALYALPRGELRRELLGHLRQGRQNHRPRTRGCNRRQDLVSDDIRIAERPEDVAGRLVPGHWEGDLIKGAANRSAVGTLVEHTSRHARLTQNTGIRVWFADTYSPWQRGSNENANGLIRQYLPKGSDLSPFTQNQLN